MHAAAFFFTQLLTVMAVNTLCLLIGCLNTDVTIVLSVLQVDVLMLDLDVGFIDSPLNIVHKLHNSKKDIFVQVWSEGDAFSFECSHWFSSAWLIELSCWLFIAIRSDSTTSFSPIYICVLSFCANSAERFDICNEPYGGGLAHMVHRTYAEHR